MGGLGPEDQNGMTTRNFTQVRAPWKLFDLAQLLAESGLRNNTTQQPQSCVFDPTLNIIEPSGAETRWVLPVQLLISIIVTCLLTSCATCCVCGYCVCCRTKSLDVNDDSDYGDSADEESLDSVADNEDSSR